MNHIGNVIQELRMNLGLTRPEISKDICSEKFLYLVEKGDRNPSADMVRLLSNKLGMDLFEYYRYLGCKDPMMVRDVMLQCSRLRRTGEFDLLVELTEKMKRLPDFRHKPWNYEIQVNRFAVMLYQDFEVQQTIDEIESVVAQLEPQYVDEEFTAGLYTMLSGAYQMIQEIDKATAAMEIAKKIISNKKGNARFHQIYISVKLTAMSLAQNAGAYKVAIEEGLDITRYQEETSSYERLNITYYFLGCAYYKNGQTDTAFQWFEKSLLNLLTFYRPAMAYIIYKNEMYCDFVQDERARPALVDMVKQTYEFIQ